MANPSLQIGDSNWAIKEDNLLGYSKAGTRFVPEPITMTRASAGTRVNSEGLVETVGSLGSELVANGNFSEEGSEEVTNGDFSEIGIDEVTDGGFPLPNTEWTLGGGAEVIVNGLRINNTVITGNAYAYQTISGSPTGNQFVLTYDVIATNGKDLQIEGGTSRTMDTSTTGTNRKLYYTWDRTDNNFAIKRIYADTDVTIDNVMLQEVGQDWTPLGTNATNTINFEANGVRFISVDQNISISQYSVLEVGKIYKFTCDVVTTTGIIGVDGAITEEGTINMTNGFNEIYFTASSNTFKIKRVNAVTNCLLSNVSVKEVGQDWTAQDGWTVEDNKAVCDGLFNNYIAQFLSLPVGNIKIKFTVDNYSSGTLNLWLNLPTFTNPIAVTDDGDYEIYVTTLSGANNIYFYSVSFIGSITNISVKEATIFDLARVDYTDGTSSLLVEPERTNLIEYSEDFSQSYWTETNASVSLSTTTSPDGLATSYKLIPDNGTGGNRSISKQFNGLSNNHTHTCFAKKGEYNYLMLRMRNSPNVGVMFDLENGTFNLNSPGAAYVDSEIQSIGNGWYKCSITLDPSQSVSVGQMYISMSVGITGSETHSFNGDGTSGIYIWGCGFEEGSYATSYIPTYGTTVTRIKDQYEKTGISDLINSEEGSFFVDIAALNASPGSQISISLSGNGSNDRVLIYTGSGGGKWIAQFKKDGTTIVNIEKNTTITNQSKLAVSWKSGKYLMYIDGDKATTYSAGSETEATTFDVGDLKNLQFSPNNGNSSNHFYGKVKHLQVYKTALTDPELITLTTI